MTADDCLLWAYERFGDKLCLTCSWQKQSSVLVHMVSELGIDIPVIELDTALFFRATYETRERLVAKYGLELIRPAVTSMAALFLNIAPAMTLARTDPGSHARSVAPPRRARTKSDPVIPSARSTHSPPRS